MTSSHNADETRPAKLSGLQWLPIAWLVVSMGLAARYIWQAWPALNDYRLPASVANYIYGEMIASAIIVLLGLYVLALALSKSRLFATAFTTWQVFAIAVIVVVMIYTYLQPDFVTPLMNYVLYLGEILIGLVCLAIVRHTSTPIALVSAEPASAPASAIARILYCLLGIIAGGFAGFWLGLGLGIAISEATEMSCFEGACGFFAFFIGLAGVLVGAIAGIILALYWSRPRKATLEAAPPLPP